MYRKCSNYLVDLDCENSVLFDAQGHILEIVVALSWCLLLRRLQIQYQTYVHRPLILPEVRVGPVSCSLSERMLAWSSCFSISQTSPNTQGINHSRYTSKRFKNLLSDGFASVQCYRQMGHGSEGFSGTFISESACNAPLKEGESLMAVCSL